MLSHRLRTVVTTIGALVLGGILVASPGLATQSLRITSPVSGTTLAGVFVVTGTTDGDPAAEIAVALAPQAFGDCAAPVLESAAVVDGSGRFAASIPSAAVDDGVYCVIVTVGDGRMSSALGDLTVRNTSGPDGALSGIQLPTVALDGDGQPSTDAAPSQIESVSLLAPVVVGAAAALALVVLVLALLQRRRSD